MAYYVYIGRMLCPVAPSKIQIKVNNKNKTLTLINEGEINMLKKPGLTDISFDILLPNTYYPFATYKSGFTNAQSFLEELEKLKVKQEPFQFIVTRTLPNGRMLFDTNIKVAMENYTIKEDSKQGFDVIASVKLKQYREYGTKTCKIKFVSGKPNPVRSVKSARASDPNKIGIGSEVIVNGRLHRDSYGNGPGQTRTNYRGRINFVNKNGSHGYHVTTPDGQWLGWVAAENVKGV